MITMTCMYCDEFIGLIPYGGPGKMSKHNCLACNKVSWLRHSNFDPESYSDEMVKVNEETKTITILV